jgi:hypothetical protein
LLADVDEEEAEPAAARSPRKPAKRQAARPRKPPAPRQRKDRPRQKTGEFIPLDEL